MTRKLELQKVADASSSDPLPPGWRVVDWVASGMTREVLTKYAGEGLSPKREWRVPDAGEIELNPRPGERVLLTTHLDQGFTLPPSPVL